MAKLTGAQQAFVVERLARFDTPTDVQAALQETFGVEVRLSQLGHYDPTTVQGQELAKRWRELFFATRERFIAELEGLPLYHRAYRLRELGRLYQLAMSYGRGGNIGMAKEILEQAAKEAGEMFTNRHRFEHTGKGGGPIEERVTFYIPDNGRPLGPTPSDRVPEEGGP